jgi:hypothetical protein
VSSTQTKVEAKVVATNPKEMEIYTFDFTVFILIDIPLGWRQGSNPA